MNIWIDILHIPQFNFYKPLIKALSEQGHTVYITVLDRGKLPKIATRETEGWSNVKVYVLGKHKMTKWSAIWDANIIRAFQLRNWARDKKIDIGFSNGMLLAWVCKQKGIPNYSFDDDPQTMDRWGKEKWNTECNFCVYQDPSIKAPSHVLRCTKEWAYLNPRTFVPKEAALEKYGVKPKEYMFLREVSVGTINYAGQESGAILGIKDLIPSGMKVLFSLEEKKRREEYPSDWILLQEPIEDIHSLIYYSAGLVSSGDSMAREAALLGVPSYYLGIRYSMPANAAASKVASLQNRKTMPFEKWVDFMVGQKLPTMTPQLDLEENKNNKNQTINKKNNLEKNTELSDACSIPNNIDHISAQEQALEQPPTQSCSIDSVAQTLSNNSVQKFVSLPSTPQNAENVVIDTQAEILLKRQQELRAHIDEEFIDINQYMLELVEGKQKQ